MIFEYGFKRKASYKENTFLISGNFQGGLKNSLAKAQGSQRSSAIISFLGIFFAPLAALREIFLA